ncbi:MAG: hypothetical protein Ta2A_11260 [Treponemataceae bacterium]|nr:MAG: hypothetical protein Ta2A_11260 [Treponemataceae bacterium]
MSNIDYKLRYFGYPENGFPAEQISKERVTSALGYVPMRERIQSLLDAGEILQDFREGRFDFDEQHEDDGVYDDPTRHPNFDLADAHRIRMQSEANLRHQAAKAKHAAAQAEIEAKKASENMSTPVTGSEKPNN